MLITGVIMVLLILVLIFDHKDGEKKPSMVRVTMEETGIDVRQYKYWVNPILYMGAGLKELIRNVRMASNRDKRKVGDSNSGGRFAKSITEDSPIIRKKPRFIGPNMQNSFINQSTQGVRVTRLLL